MVKNGGQIGMSASAPNKSDHGLPLVLGWPLFAILMQARNDGISVAFIVLCRPSRAGRTW